MNIWYIYSFLLVRIFNETVQFIVLDYLLIIIQILYILIYGLQKSWFFKKSLKNKQFDEKY